MLEDRPLFTYRLVLDELTGRSATFTFGRDYDDGERHARLTIPREDWESIDRPSEMDVDVRVPGLERTQGGLG